MIGNDELISGNVIDTIEAMDTINSLGNDLNAFQKSMAELPEKLVGFGIKFVIALIIFFLGGKCIKVIRKLLKRTLEKGKAEKGVIQFLDSFVKVALYALLISLIASFFGVATTSLIALLGSAGVAVALALQGSLSNFTGGVLILLLKPFKVGDYIIEDTNKNEGTVEEIQLFYTKLKTFDDKMIILPNGTLANSSLTNITLTPVRKVCLSVSVSYDSDIKLAKTVIKRTIESLDHVIKDKTIDVYVDNLADSAVIIGFRFFVNNEHFYDAKWQALEKVKINLDDAGICIPYNQLDVHLIK